MSRKNHMSPEAWAKIKKGSVMVHRVAEPQGIAPKITPVHGSGKFSIARALRHITRKIVTVSAAEVLRIKKERISE
jgi:hypothetical protein